MIGIITKVGDTWTSLYRLGRFCTFSNLMHLLFAVFLVQNGEKCWKHIYNYLTSYLWVKKPLWSIFLYVHCWQRLRKEPLYPYFVYGLLLLPSRSYQQSSGPDLAPIQSSRENQVLTPSLQVVARGRRLPPSLPPTGQWSFSATLRHGESREAD